MKKTWSIDFVTTRLTSLSSFAGVGAHFLPARESLGGAEKGGSNFTLGEAGDVVVGGSDVLLELLVEEWHLET